MTERKGDSGQMLVNPFGCYLSSSKNSSNLDVTFLSWEGGVVVGGEMGFEVVRFEARSSQGDSAESLRENSVCIF